MNKFTHPTLNEKEKQYYSQQLKHHKKTWETLKEDETEEGLSLIEMMRIPNKESG